MSHVPVLLKIDYWKEFKIINSDMEFLYNHLLDLEIPQSPAELASELVKYRIEQEKKAAEKKQSGEGTIYFPKDIHEVNQNLIFPGLDWKKGKVKQIRVAVNPDLPPFNVIEVEFTDGEQKSFSSHLLDHPLNNDVHLNVEDKSLDEGIILQEYGESLQQQLLLVLNENPDLVQIAGRWFPRALLVDVNIGYLNLAEAVLAEASGGPLSVNSILDQIELPTDVNMKLTEFSLNLALQEDERFDEVGPAGETLWFLKDFEPEGVKTRPVYLQYSKIEHENEKSRELSNQLEEIIPDELEEGSYYKGPIDELTFPLLYPHWRCGTLPLSGKVKTFFPTAYEAPRVQFNFMDGDTAESFSGWVVRSYNYIYGLKEWFQAKGLLPGGLVKIIRGKHAGEVIIKADKRKPSREWIRTVLIGSDGGIVFAMLKQLVATSFDERMIIAIPDTEAIDHLWDQYSKKRVSLNQVVYSMMRELSKLNPQGHVHAEEIYSAVNIIRRCPPNPILNILMENSWSNYLGDLYFRLSSEKEENSINE
jgi:hypothetical protein